jgi:hypothetical protein
MTEVKIPIAKRTYSSPTLVAYGDMALMTKGGSGSKVEAGSSNSKLRP